MHFRDCGVPARQLTDVIPISSFLQQGCSISLTLHTGKPADISPVIFFSLCAKSTGSARFVYCEINSNTFIHLTHPTVRNVQWAEGENVAHLFTGVGRDHIDNMRKNPFSRLGACPTCNMRRREWEVERHTTLPIERVHECGRRPVGLCFQRGWRIFAALPCMS